MASVDRGIPLLQNGDRRTRAEFERRWDAMPNLKVAELIDGIVYLPEIGSLRHACPAARFIFWTGLYGAGTPGVDGGCHSSIKLEDRNEPQPDTLLMIEPSHGGRARLDVEGFLIGVPELIGEVTTDSASYDCHAKLELYRRQGVPEYVVWRVHDKEIDWFVLRGDQYDRLGLSREGYFKSEVFPGLWLDPQPLIAQDTIAVLNVLQLGLASVEHQQFVERLAPEAGASV